MAGSRLLASAEPVRSPFLWVDNFLPDALAVAMRRDIDEHFSAPDQHSPEIHQVWNYWHVPDRYTYLRTLPKKVIDGTRVSDFEALFSDWTLRKLGLGNVSGLTLSLYVNGCHQHIHNDPVGGRIAFTYSLSRSDRKTEGGKTLLFDERNTFQKYMRSPVAGAAFCSAINTDFNRLILFDDRIPHGVSRVEGSMNPLEGNFVLHGHISEAPPFIEGALEPEMTMELLGGSIQSLFDEKPNLMTEFYGPLSLQVTIGRSGMVKAALPLLDRVFHTVDEQRSFAPICSSLLSRIRSVVFPPANGETTAIFPILFGGILPSLEALEAFSEQ